MKRLVRRFSGPFYRCMNCGKKGWRYWRIGMVPKSHEWGFECRYCKHTSNAAGQTPAARRGTP